MTLSVAPVQWEHNIQDRLQQTQPARSRWLHQHPQRAAILTHLVAEADETLEQLSNHDAANRLPRYWATIPPQNRPEAIVNQLVDSPELWDTIERTWPTQDTG